MTIEISALILSLAVFMAAMIIVLAVGFFIAWLIDKFFNKYDI